ncbi:MAG TPA: 3-isopropylmalate dehydratase small subunit [Reyranella sp.]|jgi:3-isopropylmalate/(R)-2-methylmalate dehydratase small subunit|nr:3-isopropylmalate dehydratase small subunit [Reyranella sp.]
MEKFTRLTGVAAPLPMVNVDTDMVIPKNYLKVTERTGLGKHLFAEMRFNADGSERPDFVLNRSAWRQAEILIAFENFGCGSSREHAPWALRDFGIRCVIAPSFADIFFNNCFKNGILPLVLPKAVCAQLIDDAERGANATLTIDLEAQALTRPDGQRIAFAVEPSRRSRLLDGLDEIGATVAKAHRIDAFEADLRRSQPWRASALDEPGRPR